MRLASMSSGSDGLAPVRRSRRRLACSGRLAHEGQLDRERLQVGRVERRVALAKQRRLRRVVARGQGQRVLQQESRQEDMILEVPSDPGEVLNDADAELPKVVGIADGGLHENLRGSDGTHRQDDLAVRGDALLGTLMQELDRSGAAPAQDGAADGGIGEHGQVRLVDLRIDVGPQGREAAAAAHADVRERRPRPPSIRRSDRRRSGCRGRERPPASPARWGLGLMTGCT